MNLIGQAGQEVCVIFGGIADQDAELKGVNGDPPDNAVPVFLKGKIGFLQMSDVIARCMDEIGFIASASLENYLETDRETRIFAGELVTKQVYQHQNIK